LLRSLLRKKRLMAKSALREWAARSMAGIEMGAA
jgi:hypothetical protein